MAKKKRLAASKVAPSAASASAATAMPSSIADGDFAAALAKTASASVKNGSDAAPSVPAPAPKPLLPLPFELGKGDWTAIILAFMVFFTPALGVPHELMLQDTLKSIIVAFMSLGAALLLFWSQRNRRDAMRWHFVMWLPIMLCAWALGSMVWSHTYLAGVEAIRWFLFALIIWLVLNSITRERFSTLAWAIHLGALAVALLGASQFWFDVRLIPQGPNPAATFVNRNFAAEFMSMTLVFSAYLIFNERRMAQLVFLSGTLAFHVIFLMMCGTRSALVASYVAAAMIVVMAIRFRKQFGFASWDGARRIAAGGAFLAVLLACGFIKSGSSFAEYAGVSPFERLTARTAAIGAGQSTFQVRRVMWDATVRMIQARPITGVGAGAWEVDVPLYQLPGSQLETDYYAHNEFLQIIGEFGLVGWLFLIGLIVYLLKSAWRTIKAKTQAEHDEGPLRAVALTSLLALMIVCNIGFPWRLAATGAMFAVCLGLLAASDARLNLRSFTDAKRLPWSPAASQTAAVVTMGCIALAGVITKLAAECEDKIVSAVKMALSISASGEPNSPRFDKMKREMLQKAREGIAINPHYRKITPMLGDELAKWGDWKNAMWVWESVLGSRPHVAAIASNIARGYLATGDLKKSQEFLEKAKKVQSTAISVRSLDIILLSRAGKEAEALALARESVKAGIVDNDVLSSAYVLAVRASDFAFAIQAMELRNKVVPSLQIDGLMKIAGVHANYTRDMDKAVAAYKAAYLASNKAPGLLAQIPLQLHQQVQN
jgi:O-antigen ligase